LARLFTNDLSQALLDAQHSAAFQIAIWDILFDNDGNLSTSGGVGQFGASGNATTIAWAQGYLDNLGSGAASYPLIQLTSRANQDFITPGPLGQVPEPSPLPLVGAGLAAMMFAMRRRKVG
jgi:hypothetical protein